MDAEVYPPNPYMDPDGAFLYPVSATCMWIGLHTVNRTDPTDTSYDAKIGSINFFKMAASRMPLKTIAAEILP